MRRNLILLQNHQHGWYERYMKLGPQGFKKAKPPTPFIWTNPSPFQHHHTSNPLLNEDIPVRPRAYFDISIDTDVIGRLGFELAEDIVPRTVENFKRLCMGEGMKNINDGSYKGSKFHLIRKNEVMMGGDIEAFDGSLSHSSFSSRFFDDENFIIPHSERGLISMASRGVHTNGSQFYIDLRPAPHLNGRCAVFGRLVAGEEVLQEMEKVFSVRGVPVRDIKIAACGYHDSHHVKASPSSSLSSSGKKAEVVL